MNEPYSGKFINLENTVLTPHIGSYSKNTSKMEKEAIDFISKTNSKMDIIFDFDGVIINSHKVKTNAFYQIFKFYGEAIALKAKRYHEKNIGKSRYFKFQYI